MGKGGQCRRGKGLVKGREKAGTQHSSFGSREKTVGIVTQVRPAGMSQEVRKGQVGTCWGKRVRGNGGASQTRGYC